MCNCVPWSENFITLMKSVIVCYSSLIPLQCFFSEMGFMLICTNVLCLCFCFFLLTLMQTVSSGSMLMMKMREDEASVASTPLAKQLSNQASDYISSPMKTKTITGTIKYCLYPKLKSSRFNLPILTIPLKAKRYPVRMEF